MTSANSPQPSNSAGARPSEWIDDVLQIDTLDAEGMVLCLTPHGDPHDISLVPILIAAFEKLLKGSFHRLFLDMRHFNTLGPGLIVFMLEATARSRRHGREFYVLRLNEAARQELERFQPHQFLALVEEVAEIADGLEIEEQADEALAGEQSEPQQTQTTSGDTDRNLHTIKIPSKVSALYKACDFVTHLAEEIGFNETDQGKIKIAVYEACLNVIEHAYHSNPNRIVQVEVEKLLMGMIIAVIDHGQGFQVSTSEDFNVVEAALKRKTGGMGLHIIRKSMDRVYYAVDPVNGNRLVMEKSLPAGSESQTFPDAAAGERR
ncbi:MAG TPA: ATP-binding protein [bacterium]|jgi:anti-sigma regulatory factor (Ser/Thr protein kinase)|nr:ATP-binding protein [bacterium]HOX84692.1 ATP-binding protein [bacterium]HPG45415.1 ATP-binding protein [bacterium]HPM96809.1 ATP-binding protein [bacterium]